MKYIFQADKNSVSVLKQIYPGNYQYQFVVDKKDFVRIVMSLTNGSKNKLLLCLMTKSEATIATKNFIGKLEKIKIR